MKTSNSAAAPLQTMTATERRRRDVDVTLVADVAPWISEGLFVGAAGGMAVRIVVTDHPGCGAVEVSGVPLWEASSVGLASTTFADAEF